MNFAVMRKTLRDTFWLLLAITLAIFVFETILIRSLGEMPAEVSNWLLKLPAFRRFTQILLGGDLADSLTATTLLTIGFAHPFVLATSWALVLTTCSRIVVGEIDRGTADLLLTLPLSRASLYASASLVGLLAGVPPCLAAWCGVWVGQTWFPLGELADLTRLARAAVSLYALYLAIGGVTLFVSSLLSRRGAAIAWTLAWLLFSFLMNFLATLLEPLGAPSATPNLLRNTIDLLGHFGPLQYHRPLLLVRGETWPPQNTLILLGMAATFWLAGLWRFSRRDIPAV